MAIYVGIAGWALRAEVSAAFPVAGTHLERYAGQLNCAEINSSFYRSHRRRTYERWSQSVPRDFRFAVKVPKSITHGGRLVGCDAELDRFLSEARGLGHTLGPLLVQLPPSLGWNRAVAEEFFSALRNRHFGPVVCEPRHFSWFGNEPARQLEEFKIARVAADPAVNGDAAIPAGWSEVRYFRWHGSPRMYYSSYDEVALRRLASTLSEFDSTSREVYCIFDNTAACAAMHNALALSSMLFAGTAPPLLAD